MADLQPAFDESRSTKPQPWRSIIGSIMLPWIVLAYVYWVGADWTAIGMGAVYVAAALIALGMTIADVRNGRV